MATYKVPQDVEADDKLLGPFSFRQFVYLMIVLGMVVLAVGLWQLFPLLAIIPIPFALFFGILALPIKKDQPMETYFAALISFYTKPNKRLWLPGQSKSTILITAPKTVEASRTRDLTPSDASHRLSFLAELVDSEGQAIKYANTSMKDEFYAEAYNTTDMFDQGNQIYGIDNTLRQERHESALNQMHNAIQKSEESSAAYAQISGQRNIQPRDGFTGTMNDYLPSGAPATISGFESPAVVQPIYTPTNTPEYPYQNNAPYPNQPTVAQPAPQPPRQETLQEQSDRIRRENESEIFIPLH